jgi:hypothetical protein
VKHLTILLAAFGPLSWAFIGSANAQNAAAIEAWNTPCLQEYANWKRKPPPRAVAVTVPNSKGQGCGFSWGASTKADAKLEALRQCRFRKKQEDPGHKDTCRISQVQ